MKVNKARLLLSAATLALLSGSSALAMSDQEVKWEAFVGNIRTGVAGAVGSVREQSTRQAHHGWQPAGRLV